MTKHFECPIGQPARCQLRSSLELSAGRGLVQITCGTCGHGDALALEAEQAAELHAEIHKHVEPPQSEAPAEAEASPGSPPSKPLGRLDPGRPEA